MASTITHAKDGSRVLSKVLQRLVRGSSVTTSTDQKSNINISHLKRQIWIAASADPSVPKADYASYPVKVGDLVYRVDSDEVFVCSRSVAASTDAAFIQMHA